MSPVPHISIPLASVLLCPLIVYVAERQVGRRILPATFIAGLVLWTIFETLNGRFASPFFSLVIDGAAFLGLAGMLVLFAYTFLNHSKEPRNIVRTFFAGALFPCVWVGIGLPLAWTTQRHPLIYDQLLYAFDGTFGLQPAFALGKLLQVHRTWLHVMIFIYEITVIPVATLFAAHRVRPTIGVRLIPLWATVIIVGCLLYNIFPAVGPVYAFDKSYPWEPVVLTTPARPILSTSDAPRNCMPSIHLALALLVWWNSRGRSWWTRLLAAAFVVATIIATLGLGEHYVADLIVAVPFSLAFQALWTTSVPLARWERYGTALTATIVSASWLIALRFGTNAFLRLPMLSWGTALLTVFLCGWLNFRLARAAEPPGAKIPISVQHLAAAK
jgi:hypothetical protein